MNEFKKIKTFQGLTNRSGDLIADKILCRFKSEYYGKEDVELFLYSMHISLKKEEDEYRIKVIDRGFVVKDLITKDYNCAFYNLYAIVRNFNIIARI